MKNSILVALKDSMSSRAVVDYLAEPPFCKDDAAFTLLHVFKKPSASEALMGETFANEEFMRLRAALEAARDRLVNAGIRPDSIDIKMEEAAPPHPTAADMIIEQFNKGNYSMVVIGRRKKSKSEEFVLGDVSVKLVRAIERAAVLVVKS